MNTKYVFITGGVVSSLGKGLTAASIAMLLELQGFKLSMLKLDPYLNIDPGTMNPYEHGEVYVTEDGAETDLDLGHYSRFTEAKISRNSNVSSGQIYDMVIKKERKGEFLGKTVQVIPHITEEIKRRILNCRDQESAVDIVIVEIGGTVGDIESLPFLESIRQFHHERKGDCINLHLTYIPYLKAAGEIKTKPTQHSVQVLRSIGIIPDMIICRCEKSIQKEIKEKIALFCSVELNNVIEASDVVSTIYEVPLQLHKEQIDIKISQLLGLPYKKIDLDPWRSMIDRIKSPKKWVTIGIVGKYVEHPDAYKSILEALNHAAAAHQIGVKIKLFQAEQVDSKIEESGCDGYLVPGGFSKRGWRGKIFAAQYCREKEIPFLGICFGMQAMCVEFAQNVLGWKSANSTEIEPETPYPIISLLNEQKGIENLGGTMRLGAYPCILRPGSKIKNIYKKERILERHRHRFEFNNRFKESFEEKGCIFSGTLENFPLSEVVELVNHPWMIGVQFHPEFQSKPNRPHPLFYSFIEAIINK